MAYASTTTPSERSSQIRVKPWAAFSLRDYRYLWGNSFSFAMIHSTERFAFVWLMLDVYGRANQAGRISFVLGIPVLFFSLQAGALADRINRKVLLVVTQAAAAAVSLALTVLLALDRLTYSLTVVLALMLGVSLAFGTPVRISTLPMVVPKHLHMNAIVLNGFAQNVTSIIGPAVAGFTIRVFDVEGAFGLSTALYVIGILFILPMQIPALANPEGSRSRREKGAIKAGLRFIAEHEGIRGLFLFLAIAAIFLMGPYGVLTPTVARVRLNRDVLEASLMFTVLGVGTIFSTMVQATLGDIRRKGLSFLLVVSGCGIMLGLIGISTSYPLSLVLMFFWGAISGFFMNLINALIQSNTPREYLGRVASVQTLVMQGITPIGALIAGWGADTFYITTWLLFTGTCMVASAVIVAITQPAFRRL